MTTTHGTELTIEQSITPNHLVLRVYGSVALIACLLCGMSSKLRGQGILTVTPGRTVVTAAAAVSEPQGVAYDSLGNLYIADSREKSFVRSRHPVL